LKQIRVTIDIGQVLFLVPIGAAGNYGEAMIYRDDFDFLMMLGCSQSWHLTNGYVMCPAHAHQGRPVNVQVARVLCDAKPGEQIRYVNKDRLDLRRHNLQIVEGYSVRYDRSLLTPLHLAKKRKILGFAA
jgi:hypothetical protein